MRTALELVKEFQAQGIKIVEGTADAKTVCDTYLTEDFECKEPPQWIVPGVIRGRYASIEITDIYAKHWTVKCMGMQFFGDAGNVVAARGLWQWTSIETGRSITVPAVEMFTIENDKIKSIEVFQFDPAGVMSTLPGKWRY